MSIVSLKILGSDYQIACDDGEEERLISLSFSIAKRLEKFANANVSDAKILLINSLIMENEILDLKEHYMLQNNENIDKTVSKALDAVSEYVEGLANRIEKM